MKSSAKTDQLNEKILLPDNEAKIKITETILPVIEQKEKRKPDAAQLTELKGLGAEIWKNFAPEAFPKKKR